MSLSPRQGLLALLFLPSLCLPARAAGIEDRAGLFKIATRDKAADAIDEIRHRTHKDLLIETINKLSADELRQYRELTTDRQRAEFFRNLAAQRARKWDVNGVYVLLCRVPAVDEPHKGFFQFFPRTFTELFPPQVVGHAVVVRPESNEAYFPAEARARLDSLFGGIRIVDHNQDQVLLDAVKQAGDELEANARALGAPPADTFHWGSVVWAAAALVGAWIVLGVIRGRTAARQGTPGPPPGADQEFAALYGAAGALWLFAAYRARRQEAAAPSQPGAGPAPDGQHIPDGPLTHPDDLAAIAGRPAALVPEDAERGQDMTSPDCPFYR
jgi:hypothetical protein